MVQKRTPSAEEPKRIPPKQMPTSEEPKKIPPKQMPSSEEKKTEAGPSIMV